jgi:hypothetical protein
VQENLERFLNVFCEALSSIKEPLLFTDERGFQGELLAEIRLRLQGLGIPGDPIIQQEYQKTIPTHGITIRPDLIVHIPFERKTTASRKAGNFVAVEMKVAATPKEAADDFESLKKIQKALRYPLIIFLNVGSLRTYADLCPNAIAPQTVCFAIQLKDGTTSVVMQRASAERLRPQGI